MVTKRIKIFASLHAWRTAQGFNQREAAAYLGVSQSRYARIEARERPSRPVLRCKDLSDKTGVPFEIVMGVA